MKILGIKITPGTMEDLHKQITVLVRQKCQAFILSGNIHGINLSTKLPWLADFYEQANLVRVDGAGVVLGARILGKKIPPRLTWADWGWPLAAYLAEQGHSAFLLGGPPGTAEKAKDRLLAANPLLKIVGTHHGYFEKTGDKNRSIINTINNANPDILIIGMGMPLQERWLSDNREHLGAFVCITSGAAFEYLAGELARCPAWMGHLGFEWLYRFMQNPHRMAKRYLLGNTRFIAKVLLERLFQKKGKQKPVHDE